MNTIVIGGSAGAFEALMTILTGLEPGFPSPIVLVTHLLPDTRSDLWRVLRDRCQLEVREAGDKDMLQPGLLLCAPPNYHTLIERDGSISLSVDPPVNFSRPSIDVLFKSAAASLGPVVTGILLSGANSDGAEGLADIHTAGGTAIVQSPESASSAIMPQAGLSAVPRARSLTPADIASFLIDPSIRRVS